MLIDADDDIWIGTLEGVSHLSRKKQIFRHYKSFPNDNAYLNNSDVYSFWTKDTNSLWVGTASGGVNILNLKTGTYKYLISKNKDKSGLSSNSIKSMISDQNGNIWIGTFQGGINVYNPTNGNLKVYMNNPKDSSTLADNRVCVIFIDSNKKIWVGTESGLDAFDPARNSFIHYPNICPKRPIEWLSEDTEHNLWIGVKQDIYVYNIQNQSIKSFPISARSRGFCEDSRKQFWIATQGNGIALIDKKKGIVKRVTVKDGLANNTTFSILEDNRGYLWIGTSNGLSRYNPVQRSRPATRLSPDRSR